MNGTKYLGSAAMIALAGGIMATPAHAQASSGSDEASTSADIIVTAQKREQALIDVPISISAMGNEALENNQINELRDLVGQVPNLFVNNFNGRSDTIRLFIRGIGQNDVTLTQDPSVALYVDGVYVGTTAGGGFETEDIERIEVLRGPQGTLYGRNATGGAVNVIPVKPQLGEVQAKGSFTYGNYDAMRGVATLNLPIGEKVAVRVGLARTKRDGLQENTGLGVDFAVQDRFAIRGALRAKPSDAVTIDYSFDYSRNQDSGTLTVPIAGAPASFPLAAPAPVPGTGGFATMLTSMVNSFSTPSPFVDARPDSAAALRATKYGDSKVTSHALTLEWKASDSMTLRSITGYRKIDSFEYADNLPTGQTSIVTAVIASVIPQLPVGTVLNVIGPNGAAATDNFINFKSWSQELQLIGSSESFDYVLGGYYYQDEADLSSVGGAIGSGPLIFDNITTTDNKSYAAFGEATYRPSADGKLSITLGARYSHDKRAATRINERSFSFAALGGFTPENCSFFALTFAALGQVCTPTGSIQPASYSQSFNNFSPSLTVAYKASEDLNLYAKYARGYKSGGTSQRSANPILFADGFRPEKVDSYEIGVKGKAADRKVNWSIAGFYMRLNDYQASVQTGATAGDRDMYGIDGNEIYGVEFDLNAQVTPELRLGLAGAALKTKIGVSSLTVTLDTGATQVQNFVKPLSYAPSSSGNAYLDYRRDLGGDWSVGAYASVNYQGKMHTSSNVADDRIIESKALVDASVTLARDFGDDREISLRLWGKNIFDKEYKTVVFGSFAFSGATSVAEYGEARTYGVTLGFRY
jgi:iron complex outermembrane recepter protein